MISEVMKVRKISELSNMKLPVSVLLDVKQRIEDWILSGGKEEDLYIQRQIEYAEKVHRIREKEG